MKTILLSLGILLVCFGVVKILVAMYARFKNK